MRLTPFEHTACTFNETKCWTPLTGTLDIPAYGWFEVLHLRVTETTKSIRLCRSRKGE